MPTRARSRASSATSATHWLLLGPFSRFGLVPPRARARTTCSRCRTGSPAARREASRSPRSASNVGAVLGITLIAATTGRDPAPALITSVFVLLLVRTLGAQFPRDPWNPYVTVLPFLLLVVRRVVPRVRRPVGAPGAVGVGSFLVQTHVGYALVVAVAIVAGVVGLVVSERAATGNAGADRGGRRWRSPARCSSCSGSRSRCNSSPETREREPARRLLRGPRPGATVRGRVARARAPARRVARLAQGRIDAERDRHDRLLRCPARSRSGCSPCSVPPRWRGGGRARRSCSTSSCSRCSRRSFVAMTRIVGDVLTYLVKWTWALGTITWIAVAWSCVAAWQARERPGTVRSPRSQQIARVGMAALVVAFATVVVVDTVAAARAGTPEPEASASMAKLGDAAFAALPDRSGVVEVRVRGRRGRVLGECRRRRRARAPRRRRAGRARARVRVRVTPPRRRRPGTSGRARRRQGRLAERARVARLPRGGERRRASPCSSARPEPAGRDTSDPRPPRRAPASSQRPTATTTAPMTAHTASPVMNDPSIQPTPCPIHTAADDEQDDADDHPDPHDCPGRSLLGRALAVRCCACCWTA